MATAGRAFDRGRRAAPGLAGLAILLAACLSPGPAHAILDVEDKGPVLRGGAFAMRVSNAGVLGNPFTRAGRSFDPSFEYPEGSGREAMKSVVLWVGARDDENRLRVSGGPILEFRPTADPEDRVREAWHGAPGQLHLVDDDGDGTFDEEWLNGRDDDGDGETDEDLGVFAQQMMSADYADDLPESGSLVDASGERHKPLGLTVHQEVYAWSRGGVSGVAGLEFRITNRGSAALEDVRLGLLADLDSRFVDDAAGHSNDRADSVAFARTIQRGSWFTRVLSFSFGGACMLPLEGTVPMIYDAPRPDELPYAAILGLDHDTDPLGLLRPDLRSGPGSVSFRYTVYSQTRPPFSGGVPTLDADRYAALAGDFPTAARGNPDDYVVLVSCGPFARLEPGATLVLRAAIVVSDSPESLAVALANAAETHVGTALNLLPDSLGGNSAQWYVGKSGINGHEACVEDAKELFASRGIDPHCTSKFGGGGGGGPDLPAPPPIVEPEGECYWIDADCDGCTGRGGNETVLRWTDPGASPSAPRQRVVPLAHRVRVEWDNTPEILIAAGQAAFPGATFLGYRVYKLSDWRDRRSNLPPRTSWGLVAGFGSDTLAGAAPLREVTDYSLDYEKVLYEQKLYPVGRYAFEDDQVLDGFTYGYMVVAVVQYVINTSTRYLRFEIESPIAPDPAAIVRPRVNAAATATGVWVVPNPYRGSADWDLPATLSDPLPRHLDFMGLPATRCTIRVWTAAGDLVAEIPHDGTGGAGQASWNLVSRNGQEVASGIYVFTVDSSLGRSTGRFVVVR